MRIDWASGRAAANQRRVPRQPRGERRLQQILDATEALVLEMPPEAITTNHIARRAGANVATVYHFFSNKIEIFQAICSRAVLELEETVRESAAAPARGAAEWITRIVDAHTDFWLRKAPAIRLWEYVRTRPAIRSVLSEYEHRIVPEYEKGLRRYCPTIEAARRRHVARIINVVIPVLLDDAALGAAKRERASRVNEIGEILRAYLGGGKPHRLGALRQRFRTSL